MTEPDPDQREDQWVASLLFDRDPSPLSPRTGPGQELAGDVDDTDVSAEPVNLDADSGPDVRADDAVEVADANGRAKKTAVMLGAGLLVSVVAIAAALTVFDRSDSAAPPHTLPPSVIAPGPAPAAAPAADADQAVRFTASANCPAGSTSAQALTDTASDSAWVCVRGAPGGQVDGQVLHIDLGRSYLLSAVAVTPGWVAKTPGGKDEWLAHRVVTRLQYVFNDTDRTIFTQDTANTHGPVTTPLAHRVLASRVTVIILQTSRPPVTPPGSASQTVPAQPGFLDSVLGTADGPASTDATATTAAAPDGTGQSSDPVDATFAVAAMTFLGHPPV